MFDRYRVLRFLGEPPPDMVSLARDETSGQTLVLHMLPEALGAGLPGQIESLEPILELLSEDPIDGVPQVIAYDLDGETPGFSEVRAKGEKLSDIISASNRRGMKLPYAAVALTLQSLARTLEEAHKFQLYHGDLRPEKILIHKRNPTILGFPWSPLRPFKSSVSKKETLACLPPEAFAGHKPDEAWDIYQLGLLAYTMYTGQRPFPELEGLEAAKARESRKIPSLSTARQFFPEELEDLIFKTLTNNRDLRLNSAREFRKRLGIFLKKAKKGEINLIKPEKREIMPVIGLKPEKKMRKELPPPPKAPEKPSNDTKKPLFSRISPAYLELILACILFISSFVIVIYSGEKTDGNPPDLVVISTEVAGKTK